MKVKGASELTKICQAKLRAAEPKVSNIISQMNSWNQKTAGAIVFDAPVLKL